jgi:hypothetical protein
MASRNGIDSLRSRLIAAYPGSSLARALQGRGEAAVATLGEWTGRLAKFDDDTLHAAVSRVIAEESRAPNIAHVVMACRIIEADDPDRRRAEATDRTEFDRRLAWNDYEARLAAGQTPISKPPGDRPGTNRHPGYANGQDADIPY